VVVLHMQSHHDCKGCARGMMFFVLFVHKGLMVPHVLQHHTCQLIELTMDNVRPTGCVGVLNLWSCG
jgi:hypothetical protein